MPSKLKGAVILRFVTGRYLSFKLYEQFQVSHFEIVISFYLFLWQPLHKGESRQLRQRCNEFFYTLSRGVSPSNVSGGLPFSGIT